MSEVSFEQIGLFIVVVGILFSIAVNVMKVMGWGRKNVTTISPQPLVVEMQKHMATKEELAKLELDVDKKFVGLAHQLESQTGESNRRARDIHRRIEAVSAVCAETKGEIKKVGENVELLLRKGLEK